MHKGKTESKSRKQ